MISAKLIKDLESRGFSLEFPGYKTIEEEINEILTTKNERLFLSLPLLFQEEINFNKIKKTKELNKILLITQEIFQKEKIINNKLIEYIKKQKIKDKIKPNELNYYYENFREFTRKKDSEINQEIQLRTQANLNKSLSVIFSEGKIRILKKILNHEELTNSELKYYYRGIKPLITTILDLELQNYLRVIEKTKKYTLK